MRLRFVKCLKRAERITHSGVRFLVTPQVGLDEGTHQGSVPQPCMAPSNAVGFVTSMLAA